MSLLAIKIFKDDDGARKLLVVDNDAGVRKVSKLDAKKADRVSSAVTDSRAPA